MSKLETYEIGSSQLTYDLIERLLKDKTKLVLSEEARQRIQHCREYLDKKMEDTDHPVYGVTTGFGSLCNRTISPFSPPLPTAGALYKAPYSTSR